MLTFVTTLFSAEGAEYRSVEQYLKLFSAFPDEVPIIIYTEPQLECKISEVAPSLAKIVCDVPVEDCGGMVLPARRWAKKDTASYFGIQLSKLKVCSHACGSLETPNLAWIDFGIFHMCRDLQFFQSSLLEIARSEVHLERLVSPSGVWRDPIAIDEVCWKHLGCILAGPKAAFIEAYELQRELTRRLSPSVTWEVNFWAMMPDSLFDLYPANHDETVISGLLGFMRSRSEERGPEENGESGLL